MSCERKAAKGRTVGYARVSTSDQNLALQRRALKQAGCTIIYEDNGVSATAKHRPAYERALKQLRPGSTFVVWRLDRAWRSTIAAIQTMQEFEARGTAFRCLTLDIDSSTPEGRKWFRDMASWAEYERELIGMRTRAGLEAARERGVRLGRPRLLSDEEAADAVAAVKDEGRTVTEVAASMNVSWHTVARVVGRV